MKLKRFGLATAPLVLFSVWGCQNYSHSTALPTPGMRFQAASTDLQQALRERLAQLSPTGDLGFFTQPESHELHKIPQDPKNPLTPAKVQLGQLLFHDSLLGVKSAVPQTQQTYSCASCHHAKAGFQAGIRQGIGDGGQGFGRQGEGRFPLLAPQQLDVQPVRTPSAMNTAWQPNMLWNGQFGARGLNQNTQALWSAERFENSTLFGGGGIENNKLGFDGVETQALVGQDVHRLALQGVQDNRAYQRYFAQAYPDLPAQERITPVTAALAIAAFERTILSNRAPFQQWLKGRSEALNTQALRGASLFFGKANCVQCHTGPALNSMRFEGLGLKDLTGADIVGSNPQADQHLGRASFTGSPEDRYHFKVPQLYNLADVSHYGHGGSLRTLADVVAYLNRGVPENPQVPAQQLSPFFKPLGLSAAEQQDLVYFLEYGLRDPELMRYQPAQLPSGSCVPNHDALSRQQLGCS